MAEVAWDNLAERMTTLYESGTNIPEAVSELANGKRGTRFYPRSAFGVLADWIRDARRLAVAENRHAVERYVEAVLEKYTGGRIDIAGVSDLSWEDFERPDDRTDDPDDYPDPVNSRYRFQLMLEELVQRARMWAEDPKPRRVPVAPEVPEIVTVERAAELIEGTFGRAYKADTIRNWYMASVKASPTNRVAWAELPRNAKRGIRIRWPVFWQYFRSGELPPRTGQRR